MARDDQSIGWQQHLIVCGLGHVGERVYSLLAALGEHVVVINDISPLFWQEMETGQNSQLVLGDARNDRILQQAGIGTARAILIVTGNDMTNVSIAADARKLNPNIRIVMRMFDQELADHLEPALGIDRVFSTSALAAPGFVAAALGEATHGSFATGKVMQVIESLVWQPNPKTETAGEWQTRTGLPLMACQREADWHFDLPSAQPLQAGDRLFFLRQTDPAKADTSPRRPRMLPAFWSGLKQWWRDIPAVMQTLLVVLLAIVAFSVFLFQHTMGLPLADAIYFVATIITTVGFGDYNFMNASPALKLYGAFLMFCGAAILATLFSIMTDLILNLRLQDILTRGSAHLRGHIVVAGLGSIGFRVMRELARRGETVVAIEREANGRFLEPARAWGPVIVGNARLPETLRKAGAAGAKAVLAITDDDVANLGIGLAARNARPDSRVVLRLFDANLAEKLPASLGVQAALSVSKVAAPAMVASALGPDHVHGVQLGDDFIVFTKGKGAPAAPAESRRLLCGRRRGSATFAPILPGQPPADIEEWIEVRRHKLSPTPPC
ncbi:MAG: NAD-binding protein [Verrucomicrobiota bacterium]